MSYSDDSSDQEWKETKPNKKTIEQRLSISDGKPKYSRKFNVKWLTMFNPWLARCDDDRNKPFCRACQCSLVCNTCHIQRHERTPKHKRNLEILINKGESAARENLSMRHERSKYLQQRKKLNATQDGEQDLDTTEIMENIDHAGSDVDTKFQFVPIEAVPDNQFADECTINKLIDTSGAQKFRESISTKNVRKRCIVPGNNVRNKLLMQIKKDKNDIMGSLKQLIGSKMSLPDSPVKERSHIDLFFESISCSVKALPPKLIAEAKMRVLQTICGLELRALQETNSVGNQIESTTPFSPAKERNHLDLFFESISSSVKALTPQLIIEAKMSVLQITCELELRALKESDDAGNQTKATTTMAFDEKNGTCVVNLQLHNTAVTG